MCFWQCRSEKNGELLQAPIVMTAAAVHYIASQQSRTTIEIFMGSWNKQTAVGFAPELMSNTCIHAESRFRTPRLSPPLWHMTCCLDKLINFSQVTSFQVSKKTGANKPSSFSQKLFDVFQLGNIHKYLRTGMLKNSVRTDTGDKHHMVQETKSELGI